MEFTLRILAILIGFGSIVGLVWIHHYWHWDGFACFVLGLVAYQVMASGFTSKSGTEADSD